MSLLPFAMSKYTRPTLRFLTHMIGPLGLIVIMFMSTASKCTQETRFLEVKNEICSDKQDNDDDGKVDCKDEDCASDCKIELTVDVFSNPINTDSLLLSGSYRNATSIAITVSPPDFVGGSAKLENFKWSYLLKSIPPGSKSFTLTITAQNEEGNRETRTEKLERR